MPRVEYEKLSDDRLGEPGAAIRQRVEGAREQQRLRFAHVVVLLDDALARQIAQAAGLKVWGTLKVLLEAKGRGLTESIGPLVEHLKDAGIWISDDIRLFLIGAYWGLYRFGEISNANGPSPR